VYDRSRKAFRAACWARNPNFRGFDDALRMELDRVGPAHADLCRDFFCRAVALEFSFFEAAYTS
jgi:thiaminase/transcriptional activator TenA